MGLYDFDLNNSTEEIRSPHEVSADKGKTWKSVGWITPTEVLQYRMNGYITRRTEIHQEDVCEFLGQIIDIFEDFLDAKRIQIPNAEKEDSGEFAANIYGTDYDDLRNELAEMMINWHIIPQGII